MFKLKILLQFLEMLIIKINVQVSFKTNNQLLILMQTRINNLTIIYYFHFRKIRILKIFKIVTKFSKLTLRIKTLALMKLNQFSIIAQTNNNNSLLFIIYLAILILFKTLLTLTNPNNY